MSAVHVSVPERYAADHGMVTAMQLCRESGATYRQVDYWTRRGLLIPMERAVGSGYAHVYPLSEVAVARLISYGRKSGPFHDFIVSLVPTVRAYGLYGHWRSDDGVLQIDLDALRERAGGAR